MTATILTTLAQRGIEVAEAVRSGAHDVAYAAALVTADTVACVARGADHPTVQRLLESQDPVGEGPATWLPLAGPESARHQTDALAVDATAAHVDEFDPVHPASGTVPAAGAVPLALQLGARTDASSREVLAAVAAGWEVAAAASIALGGPRLYGASWWPGAVTGRLGTAMTAATLLGLDRLTTEHALSLATSSMGGLLTQDVFADGHYVLLGDAAALGAQAARRAAAGLRGSDTLLDGPATRAFGAAGGSVDGPLHILRAFHKEFPCATPLQAVIRALRSLDDPAAIGKATAIDVLMPAAMLAYVSAERVVDGPPEAAASVAHAIGAVTQGRERDVAFFRAARSEQAFSGRLEILAGDATDVVELRVVLAGGRHLTHVEPVAQEQSPEEIVTRKLEATFGAKGAWPALPTELASGDLSPRHLVQRLGGPAPSCAHR